MDQLVACTSPSPPWQVHELDVTKLPRYSLVQAQQKYMVAMPQVRG